MSSFAGKRVHAVCPSCGALERHRLQYLVVKDLLGEIDADAMKMLHFAPEKVLTKALSQKFLAYETAHLFMKGVDHAADVRKLPVADGSYDLCLPLMCSSTSGKTYKR